MTKNTIIVRSVSVVAASLVALSLWTPVVAETPMVVRGDQEPVYQERVSFTDLDLRQSGDRRVLKVRVWHAAERVCRQAEGPIADIGFGGALGCTDLTYNDAKPQIAAAIQNAKSGQRVATALVMTAPGNAH